MTFQPPTLTVLTPRPLSVEARLDQVESLATLPAVATRLMQLVDDPGSSMAEIKRVISTDPALCARILKIVNSSFYGLTRTVGSVEHAVTLLGLNAIKNIAIAASLHKAFHAPRLGHGFQVNDLWTHAVAVGTASHRLAQLVGKSLTEDAFLAGLIHDLGIIIELQADRTLFSRLVDLLAAEPELSFRKAEQQIFAATHEDFGAALCRRWQFPQHLEFVAGCHHQPLELPESARRLGAIVHVADILAARSGAGYGRTVDSLEIDPAILQTLNLNEAQIDDVAAHLQEALSEAQQLFA